MHDVRCQHTTQSAAVCIGMLMLTWCLHIMQGRRYSMVQRNMVPSTYLGAGQKGFGLPRCSPAAHLHLGCSSPLLYQAARDLPGPHLQVWKRRRGKARCFLLETCGWCPDQCLTGGGCVGPLWQLSSTLLAAGPAQVLSLLVAQHCAWLLSLIQALDTQPRERNQLKAILPSSLMIRASKVGSSE